MAAVVLRINDDIYIVCSEAQGISEEVGRGGRGAGKHERAGRQGEGLLNVIS